MANVFDVYLNIFVNLKLRKAIEDVNSGHLMVNQIEDTNEAEMETPPEKEPLIAQIDLHLNKESSNSNATVDNTVTSIDSNLSNSDNGSDIELTHVVDRKGDEKL